MKELETVALFEEFLESKFHLGTRLHPKLRFGFIEFLKFNADYFAWSHEDITGIPTEVVVHKLGLDHDVPPVRQKKSPIAKARNKFVKEEVTHFVNIGSIREVRYPDWLANNVVVPKKNNKFRDHLKHLQETFDILRKHNMKLNPEKCAFGVSSGKFLGFLVSQRGIEVNPDKIKVIEDIPDQLSSVKNIQRLTGRLAALSRFISRSLEKCHRFFALLKKKNNFDWTPQCQQALRDLKRYLSSPPLLSKPKEGETSLVYLAVMELVSVIATPGNQGGSNGVRIDIRSLDLINERGLPTGLDSNVIEIKYDLQLAVNQSITHIPREENTEAYTLANLGSSTKIKGIESGAVIQLTNSVLDTNGYYEVNSTSLVWDRRNEIIDYLEHRKLPEDHKASRALRAKAARYSFKRGQLSLSEDQRTRSGRFLVENIICRFGISKKIACDNGLQFIGAKVTKFLEDLKIKRITSSPYHPSPNGQVESTNKVIIQNLKKRLEAGKGKWLEELPGVLWAYRTTAKSST
ncbi:PREDICTED: uncharacterized protein LOC109208090 [Nicotiana attenuata]|uniref:uncharacterized protein LOC109208090 n=1 Tax=Nicotiana attenuata TaxID=49451 RepID=UPI000904F599|nr:PREDICTED: uncharacterized protein LOC109208090 [Nicotiana attenuata]